ncbi:MAG: MDR family MFS transporter [Rhodospirillales bacterium]
MQLSQRDTNVIVAGAMLTLFLAALDQTIVATALAKIAADLGDVRLIAWVVSAYLLTSTCTMPISGKLSDIHGRRPVLCVALGVFLIGSMICANAPTMAALIAGRAVQGIGGGALMTLSQTTVADVVAPRERGRYAGYFATVFASSAVLGPVLGGFLTHYIGWPFIFWINLPIVALAFFITIPALKSVPAERRSARVDYAGVALFAAGATCLLLALSGGGVVFAWTSPALLAALAAAALLGGLFVKRQTETPEPILPPKFFADTVIGPVYLALFCLFGSYLAVIVMVPIFLQVALGVPVNEVGILLIPLTLTTATFASLAGRYTRWKGRYKPPPLLSLPIAVAALLALAAMVEHASPLGVAALLTVLGVGVGPIFPTSTVAVQNAAQRGDLGAVTGGLGFARMLGGAVMTAAASSLVLGLAAHWVTGLGGVDGLQELVRNPLDPAQRAQLIGVFSVLFAGLACVMAVGWALFWRVAERPLQERKDIAGERGKAA